ncbi:hypothetical protein O181_075395 [Austropuccinia psidii MF-1]|uniref:Uncharacterized protein n=1 Tax=Austropuccinia psidii MF-1 TaxID=1389203 RepID=A0A9Q3F6K7_9BASI|nr:hypothetical protein [Austropuccinia psidii MF-1]
MSWCPKKEDRLTALNPDMSGTMVHKRILRKWGVDLENSIRSRFIDTFSTEDYINAMEDITTTTNIGTNWYKPPIDNKTSGKQISRPNILKDRAPLKRHKCGITYHLADTCSKKMRINEIEIERAEDTKEKNYSALHKRYSEPS